MPKRREILPLWIRRLYQRHLPSPHPALDLLLARDRVENARTLLGVDQPVDVVPRRERRGFSLSMLQQATGEVVGDACVEDTGSAGENIDAVRARHRCDKTGRIGFTCCPSPRSFASLRMTFGSGPKIHPPLPFS